MLKKRIWMLLWVMLIWCGEGAAGLNAQENDPARFPPGRDYYVEALVSPPTPFVGERVTYVLRFYAFVLPEALDSDLPGFDGFWLGEVYEGVSGQFTQIDNRPFFVGEVYADLYPLHAGEVVISPAVLEVPETVFRPAEQLQTESLRLTVQPLPAQAPAGFNGAVGQFTLETQIDRRVVTAGEPVRLTAKITGLGNLEQMPPPVVNLPAGWRSFTSPSAYRTSELNGLRFGEKTFEWLLLPTTGGTQTLPALRLVYFDPERVEYVTLTGAVFTVEVFAARAANTADEIGGLQGEMPLREVTGGYAAFASDRGFWLLWLMPFAWVVFSRGWHLQRQRSLDRARRVRAVNALQRALDHLSDAARDPAPRVQYTRIAEAILLYFEDRFGITADMPITEPLFDDLPQARRTAECLLIAKERAFAPDGVDMNSAALREEAASALRGLDEVFRG